MSLRMQLGAALRRFEKEFKTHNRIEVSDSAIRHNLAIFKQLNGKRAIAVLKGNAYGHGIELVSNILKGQDVPYIAVDGYFEALRVREVTSQPVLIMGAIHADNFAHIKYDNFAFVVQDVAGITALGETDRPLKIHLECNTGMNRYGARPEELTQLVELILRYDNLTLEGFMSHLADADGEDVATVGRAVEQFDECLEAIRDLGAAPTLVHIAQTGGSVVAVSKYANTVRLGIGMYGINPFPNSHRMHKKLRELRPALRFISTITKVIDLNKGDQVSYGYAFTAPKDMKIGVLPVGYHEGLNRALSNVGVVKIGNQFAPIVGRVCMNHTMINLDGINAQVGDEAVVYSDDPHDENAIDAIADKHNLFNYNVLTSLSSDVRRVTCD